MPQEVIEVVEREVEVIEILERGLMGMTGPAGPQANINYLVVSSSQTVSNRQMIAADTSGGSFTLTLPPNPAAGDAIDIFDYSDTFDTNPLTIARNGQNIEGLADDLVANVEGAYFTLIFTGGTRGWQVVPRYGVSGLEDVFTTQGDLLYRGASAETRLGIGTSGQFLKVNSTATAPEWATLPDSIDDYTVVTTSQTIANGARLAADTSGGSFTLTLPATPNNGDTFYILDFAKTFDTNNLTLARNGSLIEGVADDMVCNVEGSSFKMVYTGSTNGGWQMIPFFGVAGVASVSGTAPIVSSGGATPAISITPATTSAAGSMSSADKTKLDGIAAGAEVNVNADWNAVSGDAQILNKPATFTPSSHASSHASAGSDPVTLDASQIGSGTFNNARINFAAPASIGSTTPNSGAFTTLRLSSAAINSIEYTDTSNANNFFRVDSAGGVTTGNNAGITTGQSGFTASGGLQIGAGRSIAIGTDLTLLRDAADTLAQRRTTNPQTFRLYGQITGSDVSATGNYERGYMRWSAAGGVFQIGTEKGSGGGLARALELQTDGTTRLTIAATGAVTMSDNNTMVFRTSATKFTTLSTNANGGGLTLTYTSDLNAQNADYGIFVAGGPLRVTGTDGFGSSIRTTGRISCGSVIQCTQIGSVQDGNQGWTFGAALTASASVTSVTVPFLRLAGATNQFPALKRSSTTLQVRLADDTAFAPFTAGLITATGNLVLTDNDGAQTATFDAQSKLTANRTYDLPNASGTLALTNGSTNLWIPASAWIPKTTAGCGVDSRELATNDQNFDELLFDTGSDEFADALVVMPSNYNNGTVSARFYWTASSGSGGVAWAIQGRAFANDDALDTAAGTAQLVTDTLITANDMHITAATSAVTIGGTPAANTPIQFTIYRDVSDAGDDLGVDARLLGVEIIYTAA